MINASVPISRHYEKDGKRFLEITLQTKEGDEEISFEAIQDLISQFSSGSLPFMIRENDNQIISWKEIAGKYVNAELQGKELIATIELNQDNKNSDEFFQYLQNDIPLYVELGIQTGEYSEKEIEDEYN